MPPSPSVRRPMTKPHSGRYGANGPGSSLVRFPSPPRHRAEAVPANTVNFYAIEAEFDFVMGRALAPRDAPYTREDVRAAVASVHPAIEVPDSRYTDWLSMKAPDLIGDNAIGCLLCLGPAAEGWARPRPRRPAGDRPRERRGGERGRGLERPRRPVERHGLARQPPRRQGPRARRRPRGDHRQRGGRGAVPAGRYGDRRVRAHRQGRGPLRGVNRMSLPAAPLHRHARTCSGHLLRSGSPAGGRCIPRARPCGRARRGWPERVRP